MGRVPAHPSTSTTSLRSTLTQSPIPMRAPSGPRISALKIHPWSRAPENNLASTRSGFGPRSRTRVSKAGPKVRHSPMPARSLAPRGQLRRRDPPRRSASSSTTLPRSRLPSRNASTTARSRGIIGIPLRRRTEPRGRDPAGSRHRAAFDWSPSELRRQQVRGSSRGRRRSGLSHRLVAHPVPGARERPA